MKPDITYRGPRPEDEPHGVSSLPFVVVLAVLVWLGYWLWQSHG